MRRLAITLTLAIAILGVSLTALPLAYAGCEIESSGCRHTIRVIPVGGVKTGDPIITTNPADIEISHTGNGPIKNVWLIVVLNKPTYDALNQITINGSAFLTKADFALVTTKKIPPALANSTTGYPGSNCRYEVTAIKDKMDEKGNPVYYAYKFHLRQITKSPTYFTLNLELTSTVLDIKALILAVGRYDRNTTASFHTNCIPPPQPFNVYSSFSKSTLVVPEVPPLAIAAAPIAALGLLYAYKKRKMP